MSRFEDDTELAAALREMRPQPQPRFAEELDARAGAGFPRESRWATAIERARDRLTAKPRRRLLAPAGGLALAAVVVATAVVATSESGDPAAPVARAPVTDAGPPAGRSAGSSGTVYEGEVPTSPEAAGAAGSAEGAGAAALSAPERATSTTGPYAAGAGRRDIERSAGIVLAAEPAEVRGAAARVFAAVHAAEGIVLDSSIRDGEAAAADFRLLIPSEGLGDALASISRIGEVRTRHEATEDITAPTVRTGEQLEDTRARIDGLLVQLAAAGDEDERALVESRLRAERGRAAFLRSRLSSLRRRANFARVSVRIETGPDSGGAGAPWSVGDGLDDAGRILAVAAAVAIVGLALLAPFAMILLLAWLGRRAWVRHARRTALGRA